MDIDWDDWRLFLAVASAGSMSGAARALRLGQPTLSRRMGLLEERLDGPLFVRRADGVALTPLGERLLPAAQRMADFAGDAGRIVAGGERRPEGRVRIAAPPGRGVRLPGPAGRRVAPARARAAAGDPGRRRLRQPGARRGRPGHSPASPAEHDLVGVAAIAVHVGGLRLAQLRAAAAQNYDAGDLDWIAWAPPHDQAPPNPQLAALLGERFRPVFTSNDYLVQLAAVEAGVGAMVLGRKFHRLSRIGQLVELAIDFGAGVARDLPRRRGQADGGRSPHPRRRGRHARPAGPARRLSYQPSRTASQSTASTPTAISAFASAPGTKYG